MNKFAKARSVMGSILSDDFGLYIGYHSNVSCLLQDSHNVDKDEADEMADHILSLVFSIPPKQEISDRCCAGGG